MVQSVEDKLVVRMEATLRKFERQMERGRQVAENSAKGSERAWRRAGEQITANSNRAATGLQRLTNISGRGRFVIQNTANQIGDMAVQLESGTAKSRILAQQLPQLFGGFGALGGGLGLVAPLLGTVAALAIPMGAALLRSSGDAVSLDDAMKDLNKTLGDMDRVAEIASASLDELQEKYGQNALAVRELFQELVAVNQQQALNAAQTAISAAGDELAGIEEKLRDFAGARRELLQAQDLQADSSFAVLPSEIQALEEEMRLSLQALQEEFNLTSAQAFRIVDALDAIEQANGPEAAAQAVQGLASAIAQAASEGANLSDTLTGVASAAATAFAAVSRTVELGRRVVENTESGVPLFDQLGPGESLLPPRSDKAPARKRRTGGGRSRVDPGLAQAKALIQSTRTEAEKYADELERIEDLHRRFPQLVTSEIRDKAVAALNESMDTVKDAAKSMETSFESAFANFVTGAGSARDVAAQLLNDLARLAAQSAFSSIGFGNLFGGIFGNANGNAFQGGRVTPFATGGIVNSPTLFPMRGGTGLMGEAGPEAILPLTRINGKLGVRAEGTGGGTSHVMVELGPGLEARILQQAANQSVRITQAGMAAVERNTGPVVDNHLARKS
ncbi:phage tail tape measure protein [Ruegeria jejuensis]|uniref:phage tail tape measure protein n=1 Tax=Ruegeria jejuensis TaxID=3233338 RepID=UPI00355BCEF5